MYRITTLTWCASMRNERKTKSLPPNMWHSDNCFAAIATTKNNQQRQAWMFASAACCCVLQYGTVPISICECNASPLHPSIYASANLDPIPRQQIPSPAMKCHMIGSIPNHGMACNRMKCRMIAGNTKSSKSDQGGGRVDSCKGKPRQVMTTHVWLSHAADCTKRHEDT